MARFLLFALVLAGCASSAGEERVDLETAARKLAVEECAHRVRCDAVRFPRFYQSVAQCEARMAIQYGAMLASPNTNLTPAWASQCANALAADPCSEERPSACEVLAGRGAVGASCYTGFDCADRNCAFRPDPVTFEQPRCGACEARRTTSTPAAPEVYVATGGVCDATNKCNSNFDDCVGGVCTAQQYAKAGEVCGKVAGGAKIYCAAGSTCSDRSGFSETGRCIPAAGDGQACNTDVGPGCLAPARCIGSVCTLPDVAACESAP